MTNTEEAKVRDFGLIFYVWFLVVIAAYAFGFYAIYQLLVQNTDLTSWVTGKIGVGYSFVQDYIWWIVLVAAVLFVIGILIAYLEVWLMSYIGAELVTGVIFGVTALLIGAGIYVLVGPNMEFWIGLTILIPGALIGIIVLLLSRRIILGAKLFEMSNEAVNEHKETLFPVLIFAVISIITTVTGVATAIYAGSNLDLVLEHTSRWVAYLVFFLIIFAYVTIHHTMLYFSDAINICIFKRWNNYKDASIKYALKEIWKVKGSIILFGMFMAFFDTLIKIIQYFAAKKIKESSMFFRFWKIAKKALYIIFFIIIIVVKFLYAILKFLNYYTLTIIVVEKQGFIRSMGRSSNLAVESAADIIIGKTGVSIAKGLFTMMTFGVFAVGGYFLGYYWLAGQFGITESTSVLIFSLAIAATCFFFGYLPTTAILRPISTAYKTILFFYIADPFRGHADRKTRISGDIEESISKVKERVIETYSKEDRSTYGEKPESAPIE